MLKHKLMIILNTISKLNGNEYSYFQGFHDISLLFLMIFNDNIPLTILSIQRFSEIHIKESLFGKGESNYNFVISLEVFSEILKKVSRKTYDFIEEKASGQITFIVPWIITLFTHNIDNIFLQMRIMDYLLVSHPLSIFVISALICRDEINKLYFSKKLSNMLSSFGSFFGGGNKVKQDDFDICTFHEHFQKIDMNKIDFDKYIDECEQNMNRLDLQSISNIFIEKYSLKKWYPLFNISDYNHDLIKEYNLYKNSNFIQKIKKIGINYKNRFIIKSTIGIISSSLLILGLKHINII